MRKIKNLVAVLILLCSISLAACTEQKTTVEEQTAITSMDSTSAKAKEAADKLDAQTKAVEASIEKLDKEFPSDN